MTNSTNALWQDLKMLTLVETDLIATITLNRPEKANAFNKAMVIELYSIFEFYATHKTSTRCLIVTASGARAFCGGGDLQERNQMSDADWYALHLHYERLLRAILQCPLPIIGAINGAAYGGGCELVASFDFAFCVPQATFALPETALGIIPGLGGTQLIPRRIGQNRATQLILSGQPFTAEQASSWGLVNGIFEPDSLLEQTTAIAATIAQNAPIAVQKAKQAIHQGMQIPLDNAIKLEIECYNQTVRTQDRREGVAAFNEKRPPRFTGN